MDEEIVKEKLGFLVDRYGLSYLRKDFEGNGTTETYSFYNDSGSFTITNLAVIGEVDYIYLDDIDKLESWYLLNSFEQTKAHVEITSFDPEIWERHQKLWFFKNPFFWWGCKRTLTALADVIEHQIETTGQFFGVRVNLSTPLPP